MLTKTYLCIYIYRSILSNHVLMSEVSQPAPKALKIKNKIEIGGLLGIFGDISSILLFAF